MRRKRRAGVTWRMLVMYYSQARSVRFTCSCLFAPSYHHILVLPSSSRRWCLLGLVLSPHCTTVIWTGRNLTFLTERPTFASSVSLLLLSKCLPPRSLTLKTTPCNPPIFLPGMCCSSSACHSTRATRSTVITCTEVNRRASSSQSSFY